jgi:N-acetylglucosaminyl-diphospho-decaprenol L-rhamnosyltransferase
VSAAPERPDVSILLVCYRTPDLLERCLAALAAAGGRARCETLVIDNEPLDERARELAGRHGAIYVRHPRNLGLGRALNDGMRRAQGRHFLILNPDVEVLPGAIDAMVAFLDAHPGAGLVGPQLLDPDGTLQYSARTFYTLKVILLRRTFLGRLFPRSRAVREHLMLDWDHATVRDVEWLLGAALLARREAVEDVGGMDERFFLYFEDVDWCSRMQRHGWRVVYLPQARMIHAHQRASARGLMSRGARAHLESALRFYEKWSVLLYLWKRKATEIRVTATLLTDLVLLSVAFLAAYLTRYALGLWFPGWSEEKPVLALGVYARFVPFADLVALGAFSFLGLYRGRVWRDGWREFLQLFKGIAITSLVVLATTFLFTRRPLSRFTILIFFPYALLLVAVGRGLLRRSVVRVREQRIQLRRVAVFAGRDRMTELQRRFARHGTFGYEPIYLAHDDEARRAAPPACDPVERRLRLLEDERIAEIAVFESAGDEAFVERLLPRLLRSGLPVLYVPIGEAFVRRTRHLSDFMGFGALGLSGRSPRVRSSVKRVLDVALALPLIAIGLPFHLLHRLSVRGPFILEETIVGGGGRALWRPVYARSSLWTRHLAGLRHFPALRSVLAGEMSFVGLAPLTAAQWEAAGEEYRRDPPDAPVGILHPARDLDPGEPGLLQEILMRNRHYVDTWSLGEDLRVAHEALRAGAVPLED